MFGMAGETEFDVRFDLFGVPIRIHPIFWLSSAWIMWDGDRLDRVFIGVLCIFISVLVHEMGHAWLLRRYGYPSQIVLYILGGYATSTALPTWKRISVSLAGPFAGFALMALTVMAFVAIELLRPGILDDYEILLYVFAMMSFATLIVNLMNLIPCLPLDGGHVMDALVSRYGFFGRRDPLTVLKISITVSAAVACWSAYCMQNRTGVIPTALILLLPQVVHPLFMYQPDAQFLMIFFGLLCAQSVIAHNSYRRY